MNTNDFHRLMAASSQADRETEQAIDRHKRHLHSLEMPGPNVVYFPDFLKAYQDGSWKPRRRRLSQTRPSNGYDNGSAA